MGSFTWLQLLVFIVTSICIAKGTRPTAIVRNPRQFFVEDCDYSPTITVELDGNLTLNADTVTWSWRKQDIPVEADDPVIDEPYSRTTNVTIDKTPGEFKFKLKAESGRKHHSAHSYVIIEDPSFVGMKVLAESVVSKLVIMHYHYLAASYHHMTVNNYHPKVAEYFRSFAKDTNTMLRDVMKYVNEKQATIDLSGFCIPNYVEVMMSEGLPARLNLKAVPTGDMTSSFDYVINEEIELAKNLALVHLYAERNKDAELSEFVAHDLIPRVTKVIKEHKNHIGTLSSMAQAQNRHLVEFLFDKNLKKSN